MEVQELVGYVGHDRGPAGRDAAFGDEDQEAGEKLADVDERELEEALNDRLSFRRFVGLSLEQAAPDHTVLNRFRNQLIAEGLLVRFPAR